MDSKQADIDDTDDSKLKEKLLDIDGNTDWNVLLPLDSNILDGLLICESLIKKPNSSQSDNELQGHLNWMQSFLKSNAFQYLTKILTHSKYQTAPSVSCKLLQLVSSIFIDTISCKSSMNDIIHQITSLEPNNNALLDNFNKIIIDKSGMKPVTFIKDTDDDDDDISDFEIPETELGMKFDELLTNIKQKYIEQLIESIDLNKLLISSWIIIKSATNDAEQMKYSTNLCISILIYEPDLLSNLFEFIQKDTSFILNAIQSKDSSSNISQWIFKLCVVIYQQQKISGDQIIGFFLNDILLKHLPNFEKGDHSHLHHQLCLLASLLNQYISKYNHCITEFPELFEYIISELINYKSQETLYCDIYNEESDEILIGLMTILSVLLIHNESYRDHCCSSGFIDKLWNNFLFANGQTQYDKNNNLPKCKTNKSRELGYRLIIQCLLGNNEKYDDTIKQIKEFENKINKIPNSDQDYNVRNRLKSNTGYTGLCGIDYINCLLQQFYMIPTFRNNIINAGAHIANKQSVLYQLMRLFSFLSLSIRNTFDSKHFCQAFNVDIKTDQDVQKSFNILNEKLNETTNGNLMRDHFGIETYTELICQGGCNNVTERKHESIIISLPIKNKNNLQESLKSYTATENVKDVQCEHCGNKSDILKREVIGSLPNTIFFHLQRFVENPETLQMEKLMQSFEFPLDIDLQSFIKEGVSKMDNVDSTEYYEYGLVGIIVNEESVYNYTFIKDRKTNQWLEFNNGSVGVCDDINNLIQRTFGGHDDAENAFCLIYERKQEEKIDGDDSKLWIDELIEKQAPIIWNEIFNDNIDLIHDMQFFSSDYFEFMYNLICIRPKLQLQSVDDLPYIKMATTVCFKYLSRTAGKYHVFNKFASYLRFLYSGNITASKWFLQYLSRLKTDNFSLKHFVLTSRDNAVLRISSDLIICCLKQLNEPNEAMNILSISTKFIDAMIELIDIAPLHWFRFNYFWIIFYEYSLIGYAQRNYLIDKQLINILGDLYLGRNRSPYTNDTKQYHIMGNRMYPPKFDTVIQILSILIRSCETPRIRELVKQDTMIKFSQTSLLNNNNCLHELSEIDEKLVVCRYFYDKTIDEAHHNKSILNTLNDIIVHWQYENKSYSEETIKLICEGIDKSGADHEITYHEILKKTIMIQDSLQNWRLKQLHLTDDGILDIIKTYRIQHQQCTYVCMQCIIGIMTEYKPYLIYMITKRDDWYYWDQYLHKFCHRPTYLHSTDKFKDKIEWFENKYIAFLNKYSNLLIYGYINNTMKEINIYIPLDIIPQFLQFVW